LVDTDVWIWYLRGLPAAADRLDRLQGLMFSSMSWMELLQGFRNRAEQKAVMKSLEMRHAIRLPITAEISEWAVGLMESQTLSHGLRSGDAIIAATALRHDLVLLTGNVRHFASVDGLSIERCLP